MNRYHLSWIVLVAEIAIGSIGAGGESYFASQSDSVGFMVYAAVLGLACLGVGIYGGVVCWKIIRESW